MATIDKAKNALANKRGSNSSDLLVPMFDRFLSEMRTKLDNIQVNVNIPDIKVPTPQVTVNVPEIKMPTVNVPTPKVNVSPTPVTVNVPEVKVPKADTPIVNFPEIPIAPEVQKVINVDPKGNFVTSSMGAGGGKSNAFPGNVTTITNEGVTSLSTVPGNFDVEVVHLDAEDIALTEGFMLIDLSDTANWKHSNTGHIDLLFMILTIDPTSTFSGDIAIGFLTNVDATNGDFNEIFEIHMEKKPEPDIFNINYGAFGIALETDHVFGPITANDTTWQTDVDLQGPDGNTSFSSGDGDMVMLITRTAGDMSVSITIGYRTLA